MPCSCLVNLLERVAHVREAVALPRERGCEKVAGERLKATQHLLKPGILDDVLALPGGGHRGESHLPKPELAEQVVVDRADVEVLARERNARSHGTAVMPRQQFPDVRHDEVVTAHA